jgi:peptidoglycan/LPS O-acetylase OafA/YrhL
MGDLGLFFLGLLIGVVAPALGGFIAGPAMAIAFSIIAGISDGTRHANLRWIGSWAPGLIGLLAFPLFLLSILKEQFYGPRANLDGLTLQGVLVILLVVAAAFVVTTLSVSTVTRRRRHQPPATEEA